jgi:2-keto-3-deoxy-L-rhamnonate aldolase RhmA/dienelactone hydrolase
VRPLALVALALCLAPVLASPADTLDAAMAGFWREAGDSDAGRQIDRVIRTGASFDEVYARLAAGRSYAADVPKGELSWQSRIAGGAALPTTVLVPSAYDPKMKYPVRFFLHGGVARVSIEAPPAAPRRRRFDFSECYIQVYPSGFIEAPWWSGTQLDNFDRLIARLKRTYNVDENRVHVMGFSDGGTGAFYFGLRHATAWSVLFPFHGSLRVLANPTVGAEGELFVTNLTNVPAYIVNGGRDPLYPVSATEPFIALLERAGAPVRFRPKREAGHDASWWPTEQGAVDEFERTHPRDPLPDKLSWQTDGTDRDNRFRWLVIEKLERNRSSSPMEDFNAIDWNGGKEEVFRHRRASGRVDVVRNGNVVEVRTSGVGSFTLLLAPSEFDFDRPVQVRVNGRTAFDGPIKKDVRTLLSWAARDHDRTMLFGAALRIEVGGAAQPTEQRRHNRIIDLLSQGKVVFGLFAPQRTPEQAKRVAADPLMDFVFLNMEQVASYNPSEVRAFLQAMTAAGVRRNPSDHPLMMRIPVFHDDATAARQRTAEMLNLGAHAIVFPDVETGEEASQAIAAMRLNGRPDDVGEAPAYWGMPPDEYRRKADVYPHNPDGELASVFIVESVKGIANSREITKARPTIAFPGPGTLRRVFQGDMTKVENAIQTQLASCREFDVPCGITANATDVARRIQEGFRVIVIYDRDYAETIKVGRAAAARH